MTFKITALLSAMALLGLSTSSVHAASSLCAFDTDKFATLEQDTPGTCVKLRTQGTAAEGAPLVWELAPSLRFATQCPIRSIKLFPHSTACSKVAASALKDGDSVRIDEWGKGRYQLVIQRNGQSAFHYSQGAVLLDPVKVKLDGSVRTIAYRADNVKVYAELPSDPPLTVSYYVYIGTRADDGHFVRWYDIEVFNDEVACRREIPGSADAGTKIETCPDADGKQTRQFPAGGGGEDPPG